jgi:hypothetical protein
MNKAFMIGTLGFGCFISFIFNIAFMHELKTITANITVENTKRIKKSFDIVTVPDGWCAQVSIPLEQAASNTWYEVSVWYLYVDDNNKLGVSVNAPTNTKDIPISIHVLKLDNNTCKVFVPKTSVVSIKSQALPRSTSMWRRYPVIELEIEE